MAKKPVKTTDAKKSSPRAQRIKAADLAAPEVERPIVTAVEPSLDEIRDRAYQIFRMGVNQSDPVADWFQAERELKTEPSV